MQAVESPIGKRARILRPNGAQTVSSRGNTARPPKQAPKLPSVLSLPSRVVGLPAFPITGATTRGGGKRFRLRAQAPGTSDEEPVLGAPRGCAHGTKLR